MQYASVYEVASLFKTLSSYSLLPQSEMQNRLNEVEVEINNTLRNLYRVPLTLNPNQLKWSTTLNGAVSAGATSVVLTATGTASGTDGFPYWLSIGNRIYLDYNTVTMEAATISSISGNTVTLVSPVGNSNTGTNPPITQTGLLYAHAGTATVCVSDSFDQLALAESRIAHANLIDIYFAASDNSTVNEQGALERHMGEMFLADIIEGNIQFLDCIANLEKPVYPIGKGAGTGVVWDGVYGDPGTPAFTKDTSSIFINGDYL